MGGNGSVDKARAVNSPAARGRGECCVGCGGDGGQGTGRAPVTLDSVVKMQLVGPL